MGRGLTSLGPRSLGAAGPDWQPGHGVYAARPAVVRGAAGHLPSATALAPGPEHSSFLC